MQRGHDPLGQHAGAEAARGAAGDAAVEDQLHLIGTAEIEIFSDHFFEETASGDGAIEDLGQGELGLENRELIPIAGSPVRRGEGMR